MERIEVFLFVYQRARLEYKSYDPLLPQHSAIGHKMSRGDRTFSGVYNNIEELNSLSLYSEVKHRLIGVLNYNAQNITSYNKLKYLIDNKTHEYTTFYGENLSIEVDRLIELAENELREQISEMVLLGAR